MTRYGFTFWDELYTQRRIEAISAALLAIPQLGASRAVEEHLRLAVLGASEMAGYVCGWERFHPKAIEAIANHRFSQSTVTAETNLLSDSGRGTLPQRFAACEKALRWMRPVCSGILGQLRYVQAHNCGRIEELFYPQNACSRHRSSFLTFQDTRRVRSARWRCGTCGDAQVSRLRMNPCTYQYSRSLGTQLGTIYDRGLKTLALTDSALFLPHVVPFINFDEEAERVFYQDPHTLSLILARTWGVLGENLALTIRERTKRLSANAQNQVSLGMADDLARALEKLDPSNPHVLRWKEERAQQAVPPGQAALEIVRALLGANTPAPGAAAPRQLVEHAAILDTLQTTSIEQAAADLSSIGDTEGATRLRSAGEFAIQELGISQLLIVSDFPIALCAVGYTRIARDPGRSILTPFETLDPTGRRPLYIVASETEGIYFQLDPVRVLNWLVENR